MWRRFPQTPFYIPYKSYFRFGSLSHINRRTRRKNAAIEGKKIVGKEEND